MKLLPPGFSPSSPRPPIPVSRLLPTLILAAATLLSRPVLAGEAPPAPPAPTPQAPTPDLDDLLALVRQHYYRELPAAELEELRFGAAEGLLRALDRLQARRLGGPGRGRGRASGPGGGGINRLLGIEDARLMRQEIKGAFGGIGIVLKLDQDPGAVGPISRPRVLQLIEDSAAGAAGVEVGDAIASIDGTPTTTMSMMDVVTRLRGPVGETVELGIERGGTSRPIRVTRRTVRFDPVEARLAAGTVGVVSVRAFNEITVASLRRRIDGLAAKGLESLVLDLRDCHGGVLEEAVRSADLFLAPGLPIATLERGGGREPVVHASREEPAFAGSMVVLVGPQTMSGAELVAMALQDHGRALILGQPTHGKGTSETLVELTGGWMLKVTSAVFRGPAGRTPATAPLDPDVVLAPARVRGTDRDEGPDRPGEEEKREQGEEDPWIRSAIKMLEIRPRDR